MRVAASALVLMLLTSQDARRPVRDLLTDLRASSDGFAAAELAETTLDWTTARSGDRLAVAYRLPNGIDRPRFIVGYKAGAAAWIRREIPAELGSPLTAEFIGDRLIVPTHLSPSAGVIAVLGTDLSLKSSFGGYAPTPISPDLVVVFRNLIHFAPAHPEALALYDVRTHQLSRLYPNDGADELTAPVKPFIGSPIRRRYRDRLAPFFAAAEKTQGPRAYGWDPAWFNVNIDNQTFRFDAATDTFTFDAAFTTNAIPNGPVANVAVSCAPVHSPRRSCVERAAK